MLERTGLPDKHRIKDAWGNFLLFGIIVIAFFVRAHNICLDIPVANKEAHWTFGHNLFSISLMSNGYVHFPLYQIILLAGDWVYFLFGHIVGLFKSPLDFEINRLLNFYSFFVWGRLINAFLGAITVYVIYLIGERLHNKKTGLISAAIFSFLYPHIEACRIVDLYATLVLFTCIAFLFSLDILNTGDSKYYFLGGFFVGLATVVAITGIYVIIPFLLAHFLKKDENGGFRSGKLYYGLLSVILGIFVGFPTLPWDIKGLFGYLYNKNEIYLGSIFGYTLPGWRFFPKMVYNGLGPFLFVFSVVALVYFMMRSYSEKKNLLLISFPLFFYTAMCMPSVLREHWLLTVFPFFILISAYFLAKILDGVNFPYGWMKNCVIILMIVLSISYPVWKIIKYQSSLSRDSINKALDKYKKIYFSDDSMIKKRAVDSLKTKRFDYLGVISRYPWVPHYTMSTYSGEKTRLSGTVICSDYRGGPIFVIVCKKPPALYNIVNTVIKRPGRYCVDVPVDCGEVIILASCLWASLRGPYAELLVDVGKTDIYRLDLEMN